MVTSWEQDSPLTTEEGIDCSTFIATKPDQVTSEMQTQVSGKEHGVAVKCCLGSNGSSVTYKWGELLNLPKL